MQKRHFFLVAGLFIASLFVLTGCLAGKSPAEKIATDTETFPFQNMVWLPNGQIMVFVDLPDQDVFGLQWYAIADEWIPQEISFPDDERCLRGGYYWSPSVLPDGRLGFLEQCVSPGSGPNSVFMVAYDLESGSTEQLVDGSLPLESSVYSTQYAWNPKMTRGLGDSWSDVASIYWISRSGYEFPNITIEDTYDGETRSWSLRESEQAMSDPALVPQVGMARYPAWSPRGDRIAFLATVGSIGLEYAPRHNVGWSLYLMEPELLQPERVVTDIWSPFAVKFSPDGKWLLVGGQRGQFGDYGLWLYSLQSQELTFVAKVLDPRVVWSPNGKQIAYFQCDKFSWRLDGTFGSCDEESLNSLDVSKLTADE